MASSLRGSRAFGLGSRVSIAAAAAVVIVIGVLGAINLASHHAPAPRYGGIPSWIPNSTVPVNRVVTATAAHPALAIQGDTVRVQLASGQVLVTTVGPAVPEEGQFPVPATSTCTFTVTLTGATTKIPIRPAEFTSLDELGHLHALRVTAQGGGDPPPDVVPGQTVTLTMTGVLPTGNGQLRWAPAGTAAIVSWDFDVEID
jgi:hypothetical protein